jgi:hypothetical protein
MLDPKSFYDQNIIDCKSEIKKIKKRISYLYLVRLVTFVAFVAFLILYFQPGYSILYLVAALLSLILFLRIVKVDLNWVEKEKYASSKLLINQREIDFLAHHYSGRETGIEYIHHNPHLSTDFELFGEHSLFQYINRSSTRIGQDKLALGIANPSKDEKLITQKQKAISELSKKQNFLQEFRTQGLFISEKGNEMDNLQAWLSQEESKQKVLRLWSIIVPLITAIFLVLIASGFLPLNLFLLPLFVALSVIGYNKKRIQNAHSKLGKISGILKKYSSLILLIEQEEFQSSYLKDLQNRLLQGEEKASSSLNSLFILLNRFDLRYNILLSFLLNSLVLFDIHILLGLEKWRAKQQNRLGLWFESLSEIDSLISWSVYAYNNQDKVVFPHLSSRKFVLKAEETGHPLLPPEVRVTNSIYIDQAPAVIIITGANMAGKSTFLRTLTVNMILAMNAAPVCASSFEFSPSDLMSSIKVQDSLSNNESYFYAELLRLQEIVEHVATGVRTIVVLDEILRGTNTKDKHLGSVGLLEKLMKQNTIVFIATHDLAIGELEKKYPSTIRNHCFEVELNDQQLIFDYKLKDGISRKLNASFLLKKMNITG